VTLRVVDGSCDVTVTVPWPASTASLSRPSACSSPAAVSVRAVNDAGLAGPAALVPLDDTTTTPPDNNNQLAEWSCVDGARLCPLCSLDSRLCSVYKLDGRLMIVNRTETTIAVHLVSVLDRPLHFRRTFVRRHYHAKVKKA